jgi:hypothetical protein
VFAGEELNHGAFRSSAIRDRFPLRQRHHLLFWNRKGAVKVERLDLKPLVGCELVSQRVAR